MAYDDYYDRIAGGYDELHKEEQLRKLELISLELDEDFLEKNMKVLDCGCGTGICQDYLKEEFGLESTGIDPSKGLLLKNKNLCLYGYAENLPFLDDEFDLVISLTAIQNFTDIRKGLMEMKRVGKDRFILSFLKRSQNGEQIKGAIKDIFSDDMQVRFFEEDKDMIALIKAVKGA